MSTRGVLVGSRRPGAEVVVEMTAIEAAALLSAAVAVLPEHAAPFVRAQRKVREALKVCDAGKAADREATEKKRASRRAQVIRVAAERAVPRHR